jgi:hypothetical protein
MKIEMSIFEMLDNPLYKEALIDSICQGPITSEFRDTIEYVIDKKIILFKDYDKPLYEGDDNLTSLILPSIKRVWGNTYINPPKLLIDDRLELYKLMFNIDDYIDYFIDILQKGISITSLEYLDRSCEFVRLIVDNYVGRNFQKAYTTIDVKSEISSLKRELKINKIIK